MIVKHLPSAATNGIAACGQQFVPVGPNPGDTVRLCVPCARDAQVRAAKPGQRLAERDAHGEPRKIATRGRTEATCQDCPWVPRDNAAGKVTKHDLAKRHTWHTGHTTLVTRTDRTEYKTPEETP